MSRDGKRSPVSLSIWNNIISFIFNYVATFESLIIGEFMNVEVENDGITSIFSGVESLLESSLVSSGP